ncbi:hypothetical protein [Idiomarina seosinensis]|nr:hypothetical protein [Idiomarina seosinensis]
MQIPELFFSVLIIAALVITCLTPVILLALFIKDYFSKTIW